MVKSEPGLVNSQSRFIPCSNIIICIYLLCTFTRAGVPTIKFGDIKNASFVENT